MERSMFWITIRSRMTNQLVRQQTKVVDSKERIASLSWSWAGHIGERGQMHVGPKQSRSEDHLSENLEANHWIGDMSDISKLVWLEWLHKISELKKELATRSNKSIEMEDTPKKRQIFFLNEITIELRLLIHGWGLVRYMSDNLYPDPIRPKNVWHSNNGFPLLRKSVIVLDKFHTVNKFQWKFCLPLPWNYAPHSITKLNVLCHCRSSKAIFGEYK